jgi:hypothetical protein
MSLFLVLMAVQAQTAQPQPPAPYETAGSGIAQYFLGWLRQLPLHGEEQFQDHHART